MRKFDITHKGTVMLETERLILRRFTLDDTEPMFKNWASDMEVTKYLTWPTHENVDISRGVIKNWLSDYESENKYNWAIELKSLREPIGSIAAVKVDDSAHLVHIGYCIGKYWWHRGYTSEALARLVRFFFEEVGVNRVEARFDPRNTNSGKVMAKTGLKYEGIMRQADRNNQGICDASYYAILAEDYFNSSQKTQEPVTSNVALLRTSTDLMFYNLKIAMDTVDWNADICGAPAWRYIYHTLHSADKWFINPSKRNDEPEPTFHTTGLDNPNKPSDTVLDRDTLYAYYEQVRQKVLAYLDSLNDSQLNERPEGCTGTRLGLTLAQFRHMYVHIGILNGITISKTARFPRVINEGTWRSGNSPGLFEN